MGYELARAASAAGHDVTLITAPTNLQAHAGVDVVEIESACDMFEAVKRRFGGCDCMIMAAAVSDYTPLRPAREKIKKSGGTIALKLKPTPDILKWAGNHRKRNQVVAGFALDDRNLRANARRKLLEKNLDIIIANKPSAISAERSSVWIKTRRGGWLAIINKSKTVIAGKIIRLTEEFIHCSKK
jgi:phosphopantothenoylcysteine decarboxylase/phosphopantothenate--cysteine ligase